MARNVLVVLVLLGVSAGLLAALYPWIDCPDCPFEGPCIRCRDRRQISLLESLRREPLDPDLVGLLNARGVTALCAGALAVKHGRARVDTMGWKDDESFFFYANATLVEGRDGPLVLAVLTPKTWGEDEGNPARVLLYDRRGRELDRRDVSSPGFDNGPSSVLEWEGRGSVLLKLDRGDEPPHGPARIVKGSEVLVLDPQDWPKDYRTRGIARIVVIDGRLVVVAP